MAQGVDGRVLEHDLLKVREELLHRKDQLAQGRVVPALFPFHDGVL